MLLLLLLVLTTLRCVTERRTCARDEVRAETVA